MGSALSTLMIIGLVIGIAATVFLYVKVMPRKNDGKLGSNFLQFLHDFFHFKHFYIEDILKFLFTLGTCVCIAVGFMLLFGRIEYYYYGYGSYGQSTFLYGLLLMAGGPFLLRIAYELTMMLIMLVKNVSDINGKLKPGCHNAPAPEPAPEPVVQDVPAQDAPAAEDDNGAES